MFGEIIPNHIISKCFVIKTGHQFFNIYSGFYISHSRMILRINVVKFLG